MSMLRTILPAAFALVAVPALAASPFDGTWKTDLAKSRLSTKPDVIALAKGIYSCTSCTPPITVPADGKFHPVTGRAYTDSVSVTAAGPRKIVVKGQKGGKPVYEMTLTASADGKALTTDTKRTNLATGATVTSSQTATRVAAAPAGASAVSGSWKTVSASASDGATTQTLKVVGNALTLSTPTGESYTATFGGPPVTQKNDVGKTMISLRRIADDHIVETDTREGKPASTYDMMVAPGGRTMTMTVTDDRSGAKDVLTLVKQ